MLMVLLGEISEGTRRHAGKVLLRDVVKCASVAHKLFYALWYKSNNFKKNSQKYPIPNSWSDSCQHLKTLYIYMTLFCSISYIASF